MNSFRQPERRRRDGRINTLMLLAAALLLFVLSGCAALGAPEADTFNKKVGAGYVTIAAAADIAVSLYNAGKLSRDEATKVEATLNEAVAALGMAQTVAAGGDSLGASQRLAATIMVLTELKRYLATKQGSPT